VVGELGSGGGAPEFYWVPFTKYKVNFWIIQLKPSLFAPLFGDLIKLRDRGT